LTRPGENAAPADIPQPIVPDRPGRRTSAVSGNRKPPTVRRPGVSVRRWDIGAIAVQLRRTESAGRLGAYLQLGAGLIGILTVMFPIMIFAIAAFRPERDPPLTELLDDVGWPGADYRIPADRSPRREQEDIPAVCEQEDELVVRQVVGSRRSGCRPSQPR
jgi:hypothetical protein